MTMDVQARKPRKGIRILTWIGVVLLILVTAAWITLRVIVYSPSEQATSAMISNSVITVTDQDGVITFEPAEQATALQPSVIFYPGGLVEPESYSPWARQLAEAGYRTYILRMPMDLAVFGANKADPIIDQHPDETFVIGGHSLGGAMAARYAASHTDKLAGVFFMGAYADEKGSLADSELKALQLTGDKDGVLNWDTWEASKVNMPADTTYVSITGGNHAQFGSYGPQKGDQTPSITEEEQHQQIAKAMVAWLEEIRNTKQ